MSPTKHDTGPLRGPRSRNLKSFQAEHFRLESCYKFSIHVTSQTRISTVLICIQTPFCFSRPENRCKKSSSEMRVLCVMLQSSNFAYPTSVRIMGCFIGNVLKIAGLTTKYPQVPVALIAYFSRSLPPFKILYF